MKTIAMLCLLLLSAAAGAADDVKSLLTAADRWRTGADALQVETQVTTLARDGSVDKERRYTVFVQPGRRSLVLMRSPAEAGQPADRTQDLARPVDRRRPRPPGAQQNRQQLGVGAGPRPLRQQPLPRPLVRRQLTDEGRSSRSAGVVGFRHAV